MGVMITPASVHATHLQDMTTARMMRILTQLTTLSVPRPHSATAHTTPAPSTLDLPAPRMAKVSTWIFSRMLSVPEKQTTETTTSTAEDTLFHTQAPPWLMIPQSPVKILKWNITTDNTRAVVCHSRCVLSFTSSLES